MKNEKIRKIDQHMNAMHQMQSLERMLTLVPLVPLKCLWLVSCEFVEKKTLRALVMKV